MLLVAYLSVSTLLLTAFCVTGKKLHLFELAAVWMAVSSVNALMASFLVINVDWIGLSGGKANAVIRVLNMQILTPLIVVWLSDRSQTARKWIFRIIGYLLTVALLLLGGWLLSRFDVIHFNKHGWIGYTVKEAILPVIGIGALRLVRYLMRKDGIPYGQMAR